MVVSVLTVTKRTGWEDIAIQSLKRQKFKNFEWVVISEEEVKVPHYKAPQKTRTSNLNASLNEGIRKCKGNYIVFYQDFIDLDEFALMRLVENATIDRFISTASVNPDGKMDARYLGVNTLRPALPEEWEANFAIAPTHALYDIGGFDEEYDERWSWDNVNVAERAAMLGYEFFLDEAVQPILHKHEASDIKELNGDFHAERMREIRQGKRPLKVDYLV